MNKLMDWLDHRTGYRGLMHEALFENIPGGSRWRYVWGSTLVFTFTVQMITGICLWMAYSPSAQTAWESVYYIQYEMQYGWLVRGIHHFTAQAMIVLLMLHLMQVIIDGAYRAPREVNFWLGLVLMLIVLGLSLTGYLLPWDQKGYWATIVATNLMVLAPQGEITQSLVVGGDNYGHHTLTRFFALHAGLLPALLIGFLVVHVAVFRRHKITAKQPLRRPDASFWPDQVLKDAVACLAVLAVVLLVTLRPWTWSEHAGQPPGEYMGAELGAPADPANAYAAARPEWYFLFLFQFLKLFEGWGETGEFLGAILVPGFVLGLMFLMPIFGRWKMGHRFNLVFVACLVLGVSLLTVQAWFDDYYDRYVAWHVGGEQLEIDEAKVKQVFQDDPEALEAWHRSRDYGKALAAAEHDAHRARELARSRYRIPPEGAAWMMRNDPEALFIKNCASCHSHADTDGNGVKADQPSAPNLYGFASRRWIGRFLDEEHIATPEYFGGTAHAEGTMVDYVQSEQWTSLDAETRENVAIALSARARLPAQREADLSDAARIEAGNAILESDEQCAACHVEGGGAPTLVGYGTASWIGRFVSNPAAEEFYGENNDRMPAFCLDPFATGESILTPRQIQLIADWLRGDFFVSETALTEE